MRFPNAYFDLGLAYLAVDEPAAVIQIFGSLANRENVSAASYNNQGVALMRLGRHAEAMEAFQLAMDADGSDTTFLFNLGWSQWRLGKGASALGVSSVPRSSCLETVKCTSCCPRPRLRKRSRGSRSVLARQL